MSYNFILTVPNNPNPNLSALNVHNNLRNLLRQFVPDLHNRASLKALLDYKSQKSRNTYFR